MTQTHPLLETKLGIIRNWDEWLKLWNETPYLELRHSLLHFGFDVPYPEDNTSQRILFYLSIADGWNDISFEPKQHHLSYPRNPPHLLKGALPRKAFEVLCLRWFKPVKEFNEEKYKYSWVCDEQVLLAVLAFFYGIDPSHYKRDEKRLKNLTHGDSDKHSVLARTYLVNFIIWAWRLLRHEADEKLVERLASHRPAFVEVLDALGRLDVFTGPGRCGLDDASRAKLEELALGQEHYFPLEQKERRPKTLEEAVYVGSLAAQLLLLHRVTRVEHVRLKEIRDLETEQRSADRRLQELKKV